MIVHPVTYTSYHYLVVTNEIVEKLPSHTLPQTNIAPENGWLEY